jgi:hypothetical protein
MQHEFVMSKQAQMHGVRSPRTTESNTKDFSLGDLPTLTIMPVIRSIHRWWLQRAEQHYLICANVEEQRAREAHANVAYYQKCAALARSARI